MSEDTTGSAKAEESAPLAGERLAAARRQRNMSLDAVARGLHLDEIKVRALEQNAFDVLGAPVFAKGYLRKYAELVGVSVDDILADYYRLNRGGPVPLVVTRVARPERDLSLGPWIVGFLLVLIVAGAAWWWFEEGEERFSMWQEPAAPAPPAGEGDLFPGAGSQQQELPLEDPATDTRMDTNTLQNAATDAPADLESSVAPGDEPDSVEQPQQVPDDGRIALRLAFSGDCWAEVTDASGQRLFAGLGAAGQTVDVAGEPPLQLLLGMSANVRLTVDGSDHPIPLSARRGNTARLTIPRP